MFELPEQNSSKLFQICYCHYNGDKLASGQATKAIHSTMNHKSPSESR